MAIPNTRATLKDYCLRALGKPVIDINVDADQIEDRIDEAVQYFAQYHTDGVERMYLKYKVTADDKVRLRKNISFYVGKKIPMHNVELEVGLVTGYSGADIAPMLRVKKGNWFMSPTYETTSNTVGNVFGNEFKL